MVYEFLRLHLRGVAYTVDYDPGYDIPLFNHSHYKKFALILLVHWHIRSERHIHDIIVLCLSVTVCIAR